MPSTVRDVIIEAASRAKVCPRARKLPDDQFVSCLQLFNGVMEEMSNADFVTAYQSEVDFNATKDKMILGPNEDDDVQVEKLQMPKKAMYRSPGQLDWTPLNFIAYEQFYSIAYNDFTVSWKPKSMNEWTIFFKPRFVQNTQYEVKLIYNNQMEFKDNDVLNLPVPYVELITRALAYKISVKYPRLDEAMMNRLKQEEEDLERDLKAANSSLKIITRGGVGGGSYLSDLRGGVFIQQRW